MRCFLLLLLIGVTRASSAQELAGIVGRWKMDNICELTDESAQSSTNGVITDISLTANKDNTPNSALLFNLNTSYISLGTVSKLKLVGDKSISFWINPTITGANRTGSILCYGTGIIIRYEEVSSVARLNVLFGNTSYLLANLTANQWQRIDITFKKDFSPTTSKVIYYVNGAQVAEAEKSKTTHDFDNAIAVIGPASQSTLTNGFRGSLDDLKIYDRTLTATEVLNVALPTMLEFFRAKRLNNSVELSWRTVLEESVLHFVLQKSIDGVTFKNIGQMNPGKYNYLAYDVSTEPSSIAWYRLCMVDLDGKTTFSNVVRVNADDISGENIKLFPNPGSTYINIIGASSGGYISIVNTSGVVLRQKRFLSDNAVDVSGLMPGLYYIVLANGGKRTTLKFNKR